jgi:hypothetical protein
MHKQSTGNFHEFPRWGWMSCRGACALMAPEAMNPGGAGSSNRDSTNIATCRARHVGTSLFCAANMSLAEQPRAGRPPQAQWAAASCPQP